MYKHILIATDGSELAAKGVEHGLTLANCLGASVTVVSVVEPLRPELMEAALSGGMSDPLIRYEQQMDHELAALAATIKSRAGELKVPLKIVRETDESPAGAIVRLAQMEGCDLIVMTSHGRTGNKRMLLGSQTAEVLKNTAIPVLVVQ
jgi:nucleotide-binding universal stress UspA family protein